MTVYPITPKLNDTQLMGLLSPIRKPEAGCISHMAAKVYTFIKRVWIALALRTFTFYSDKKIYDALVTYSRQPNSLLPAVQSFFSPLQARGFTADQTELLKVNILGRAINEALPGHYKNIFDQDRTFLEEILKLSISTNQKPLFESISAFITQVQVDQAIVMPAVRQALMSVCSAEQLVYVKPLLQLYKSDALLGELLSNLGDIPHSEDIILNVLTQISDKNVCIPSIQNLAKTAILNKRWELAQHVLFYILLPDEQKEALNDLLLEKSLNLSDFYAFLKNKNADAEIAGLIKCLKELEAIQDEKELQESTPAPVADSWITLEDPTIRQEFEGATKLPANVSLQMVELLKGSSTDNGNSMIPQALEHKMYQTANVLYISQKLDMNELPNLILDEIPGYQEYMALSMCTKHVVGQGIQFTHLHSRLLKNPDLVRIAIQKGWSCVFKHIPSDNVDKSSIGFFFLAYSEQNFNPTIWNQLKNEEAIFNLPMSEGMLDIEQFQLYNQYLIQWKERLNSPLQEGASYFRESLKDYLNCCENALKSQLIQKNGLPTAQAIQCFNRMEIGAQMEIGAKIEMTESQFKTTTDFLSHYVAALENKIEDASSFFRLFVSDEKIKENATSFLQLKQFQAIINFLPEDKQIELCVNCLKEVNFKNNAFIELLEKMQKCVNYTVFDGSIKQTCKEKPDFKTLITSSDKHFKDLISIRQGYFHELKNECIEKQKLEDSIPASVDTQASIAILVEQHIMHLITSI